MARSTAVKKAPSTAVATLEEQLRKDAAEQSERTSDSQAMLIRLKKDKTFEMPDGTRSPVGSPLRCIVVEHGTRRAWFDRPYKEGEVTPPACAAGGLGNTNLVPYEDAPKKQAKECESCAFNQWGSDPKGGDGKACRESRMLALIPVDKLDAPIMLLQVPPTSLKNYDGYVRMLDKLYGRPPYAYATEIKFDSTVDYQKLIFENPQNLEAEAIMKVRERREQARDMLVKKPDFSAYTPPGKPQAKGRGGRV